MTKSQIQFLQETPLLDFKSPSITALIQERGWEALKPYERIGAIYGFVRNEILFGYNTQDALPASRILKEGYGQCNTKAIVLMALFRAAGIPCRLHGFTIKKQLQKGIVPEFVYPITPPNIIHAWVEILHEEKWINLEGFILDAHFLSALQVKFKDTESICVYGAGTDTLSTPDIEWQGRDTYIQKTGINRDFGVFGDPDSFYAAHPQPLSKFKSALYRLVIRHWMNARVEKLRRTV